MNTNMNKHGLKTILLSILTIMCRDPRCRLSDDDDLTVIIDDLAELIAALYQLSEDELAKVLETDTIIIFVAMAIGYTLIDTDLSYEDRYERVLRALNELEVNHD